MNPLTNVKNITKLNETELASGSIHKKSWHDMYKESAWIFVGGLQYGLTEGDILAVFSQYGEIVNINLVRDKKTGTSKGFCFLCYSNQKSTVLAVDNFNGMKLCSRTIRVDHVSNYKPPKEDDRDDEITKTLKSEGCAPKLLKTNDASDAELKLKKKKSKKEKKERKKKKKNKTEAIDLEIETSAVEVKKEKHDPGYEKYDTSLNKSHHATEIRHRDKSLEISKGESSQTQEKYRSKVDKPYNRTSEKSSMQYVDNYANKGRLLRKNEPEKESSRQHKESFKDSNKYTSSSDNDTSRFTHHVRKKGSDDTIREKSGGDQAKDVYSDGKRIVRGAIASSSSSSDDGSSTQSSSDDEKSKRKSKHPREDQHRTYSEKRSFEKESRHYNRSDDSNYTSKKSKDHDNGKKYSEHKSKRKYQSDDSDDTGNRKHYKKKHDRR